MQQSRRDVFIRDVFSTVAPRIDLLSAAFSLGLSHVWRRRAVSLSGIREGDRVLDVCTGTGQMAFLLLRKVGDGGSVTGVDFCGEMLGLAREKLEKMHNPNGRNISFEVADAKRLDYPDGYFDAVTVSFGMRNIPDNRAALREINRVLRDGGLFVCLELTRPGHGWFRHFYRWYVFRFMPFVGGLVTGSEVPYSYLSRSIYGFHSAGEFRAIIEECGFYVEAVRGMTFGAATLYRARKSG